jgi:hypothetical protein
MVVGMPFKDIATSDSIYLPEVPAVGDAASRKVLTPLRSAVQSYCAVLCCAVLCCAVLLDRLCEMTAQSRGKN